MPDPEVTEITELHVDEGVHGVREAANGLPFLVIKSLSEEEVVIKELEEYEEFAKAKYSAADKKKMLAEGSAMANDKGNASYPIKDQEDLEKAIKAVGRGGADHDAIRKHIIKRANALGLRKLIPKDWAANGSIKVAKAADNGSTDDDDTDTDTDTDDDDDDKPWMAKLLDAPVATADVPPADTGSPEGGGGVNDPGSPEWEDEDAQALIAAGQAIAQTIKLIGQSRNREAQEVEAGHAEDMEDVCNLSDAICSLEYALRTVAAMAFHEEAEGTMFSKSTDDRRSRMLEETRSTIESLTQLAEGVSKSTGTSPGADLNHRKELLEMEFTEEQFNEAVAKAAATAVDAAMQAKATADAEAVAKAEADAVAKAAAEADAAKTSTSDIPPELADIIAKATTAAVEAAMAPIAKQVSDIAGAPAPGGPILGQPMVAPSEAHPRSGGSASTTFTPLQEAIAKAQANGDTLAEERFRKQLANDVLRGVFAGRGYDDTPSRQQRMNQQVPTTA